MKDQNENDIPNDLVLIPEIDGLTDSEIIDIETADWYEVNGIILVSAYAINYLSEMDPKDAGIESLDGIIHINDNLKRCTYEDGFYHA